MITYPRLLPAAIKFKSQGFGIDGHEARSEGFNRKTNVQVHAGGLNAKHGGVLTTPYLSPASHRVMRAFLQSLSGGRTFQVYDMDRQTSSHYTASTLTADSTTVTADDTTVTADVDSLPGLGRVNGDQTGRTLVSDGWKASTDLFDAGDMVSIAGHPYTTLEDVTSDSSGNATFPVDPPLKNVLDNAYILTRRPHMVAMLLTGSISLDTDKNKSGSISFAFEEVL